MSSSDIIQAIRPLIQLLEHHAVRYYIGDSVASSAHGLPRTTIDVDIVLHKLHWFRLGGQQSERQWADVIGVLKGQM